MDTDGFPFNTHESILLYVYVVASSEQIVIWLHFDYVWVIAATSL